jgi:hypothetical protein
VIYTFPKVRERWVRGERERQKEDTKIETEMRGKAGMLEVTDRWREREDRPQETNREGEIQIERDKERYTARDKERQREAK